MPDSVDQLSIEITSSTGRAQRAISRLISKMGELKACLSGFENGGGFENVANMGKASAKSIQTATDSAKSFQKVAKDIAKDPIKADVKLEGTEKVKKELADLTQSAPKINMPNFAGPEFQDNSIEAVAKRKRIWMQIHEEAAAVTDEQRQQWAEQERRQKEFIAQAQRDAAEKWQRRYGDLGARAFTRRDDHGNYRVEYEPIQKTEPQPEPQVNADHAVQEAEKTETAWQEVWRQIGEVQDATIGKLNFDASQAAVALGGKLFGAMKNVAGMTAKMSFKLLSKELGLVANAAGRAGRRIVQLSGYLAGMPFRPITKHIKGFGSGLKESIGDAAKNIRQGIRLVTRYVFGFRTLFYAARALRGALKDAFENLAHYSSNTNANLSLLSSRLGQLKNSLASAFDPILTVVTPILDQFLQYIVTAMNAVAQFFATLTGASTWNKATLKMTDYAAGADKAASGSGKARKSAEELKKTLMSFDKINKLDDPDSSSGSGSGGSGGGGAGGKDYSGMFTTEQVSTGISDFANMVKDAWAKADFTEVGKVVAEKLAGALNSIPWEVIQGTTAKFGKSFATFINGVVSVTELATAIGKTIGESINTIFTGANSFITNLNFKAVGNFIAEAMNSGISTVNWGLIADTLASYANGKFDLVATWAGKFNFGKLGASIRTAVTGTLNGIQWGSARSAVENVASGLARFINNLLTPDMFSSVGKTIGNALNTAISGAHKFIGTISWENIGKGVGEAINQFAATFDPKEFGATFEDGVKGICKFLATAIGTIDFKTVGADVATALTSINWGELFENAADTVQVAADALGKFLDGLLSEFGKALEAWFDKHVPQEIKDFVNNFIETYKKLTETNWGFGDVDKNGNLGAQTLKEGGEVRVTGVMKDVRDEVPEAKKKVDNIKGQIKTVQDAVTNSREKVINGMAGAMTWIEDHIPTNGKFVDKVFGRVTNFVDGIAGDSKVIGGMKATFSTNGGKESVFNGVIGGLTAMFGFNGGKEDGFNDSIGGLKANFGKNGGITKGSSFDKNKSVSGLTAEFSHASSSGLSKKEKTIKNVSATVNKIKVPKNKKTITLTAKIAKVTGEIKKQMQDEITATMKRLFGGHKATGGAFYGNTWHSIPQYADGGIPNYGTVFVAGERGAEAVGNINGRTEVLNQSQMASVMYDAVVRGMVQALSIAGANGTDVHVHLDANAKGLFRVVQTEANNYTNMTGKPAFNI